MEGDVTGDHGAPAQANVQAATQRLVRALNALEEAVEQRGQVDRSDDALATRLQALGVDRSRLADALDQATARTRSLERVNQDVTARLDQVIDVLGELLGKQTPAK